MGLLIVFSACHLYYILAMNGMNSYSQISMKYVGNAFKHCITTLKLN